MVSYSVRPTDDDQCSDLKQSVKCFEETLCAAKATFSNFEIEKQIQQAFETECSAERMREINGGCSGKFMFCLASFCASICKALESSANLKVEFHLQICVHNLPGCGSKLVGLPDFAKGIKDNSNRLVLNGKRRSEVQHRRSMTNCLLRFYRDAAGLEGINPVHTLFQSRGLLGFNATTTPVLVESPPALQQLENGQGTELVVVKQEVEPLRKVETKRSETETLKGEGCTEQLKASDLRDELSRFLDPDSGWVAQAQRLQSQLEAKDTALQKQSEEQEEVEKNIAEFGRLKATSKALQAHFDLLRKDLSREKHKTADLAKRAASTEGQREQLQKDVEAYQVQLADIEEDIRRFKGDRKGDLKEDRGRSARENRDRSAGDGRKTGGSRKGGSGRKRGHAREHKRREQKRKKSDNQLPMFEGGSLNWNG